MIIGIDPGKQGAIVATYIDDEGQFRISFCDTPTKVKPDGKRDYDIDAIIAHFAGLRKLAGIEQVTVVIEGSQGMAYSPTEARGSYHDRPTTAFEKGRGFGILETALVAAGLRITYTPRPGDWKRKLGLTNSKLTYHQKKEVARLKAIELFPEAAASLARKKDSDRAEALLLTVWGELKITDPPTKKRTTNRVKKGTKKK